MEALALGIVAIVVSLLALCTSTLLAARQVSLMRRANDIPAVVQLLSEFRSRQFHDDYIYVTTRLRAEHDPQLGITALPDPAKSAVLSVAYYYQNFAFLIGFEILDERKVMAVLRTRIIDTWSAIGPYVLAERTKNPPTFLTMLEALAERASRPPVMTRFFGINRLHPILQAPERYRAGRS